MLNRILKLWVITTTHTMPRRKKITMKSKVKSRRKQKSNQIKHQLKKKKAPKLLTKANMVKAKDKEGSTEVVEEATEAVEAVVN